MSDYEVIEPGVIAVDVPETGERGESGENPAAARGSWPKPQTLPEGLPPVAAFDFALLPGTLRPWVQDICERVQCAPDYVGVAGMTALGSVIGRKVGIRPPTKNDWTVTPNQWGHIIARPGI